MTSTPAVAEDRSRTRSPTKHLAGRSLRREGGQIHRASTGSGVPHNARAKIRHNYSRTLPGG